MQKTLLPSLFIILMVVLTSFSALGNGAPNEGKKTESPMSHNGWWEHWIRDTDFNGIDDVLDEMTVLESLNTRVGVFIHYDHLPSYGDVERLSGFDLEVKYVYNIINTVCLRKVLLSDLVLLKRLPGVVMIEYEEKVYGYMDVGARAVKARDSQQYSPNTVFDMNILGRGVVIAILDSGVDDGPSPAPPPYHDSVDDLDDNITTTNDRKFVAGIDASRGIYVTDGSFNPDDGVLGHGTHVASTAMGTGAPLDGDGDGEFDNIGVAPQARLVDIKVMENWGSGVMGEVVLGLTWMVEHKEEFNIRIASMSIGGNYQSDGNDAASQAVNAAVDAGIVVVVAAGNGGSNIIGPPASADKAITVGALDDHNTVDRSDDNWWSSSNVGPRRDDGDEDHMDELKPDVLAPGVNIMAAKSDTPGTYIQFSGTSMACPHVAGVVALMLEANPALTPAEVKNILRATAEMPEGIENSTQYDDVYNYAYGWGFVDAFKAVRMAQQNDTSAPLITNVELTGKSDTTATIQWGTNKPANSIIEYGTDVSLGQKMEDLSTYEIFHSMTLTGLAPSTQYYFNVKGFDENGFGPGESGIQDPFTTEEQGDTIPPVFVSGPSVLEPVGDTSVVISWKTNEVSDSYVEYGLDTNYGSFKSSPKYELNHTIKLTGLLPDTLYHFRVRSADPSGNQKTSTDLIFKTAPEGDHDPPEITSGPQVMEITHESAKVVWETASEAATSRVRYGETLDYEYGDVYDDYLKNEHSLVISSLHPSTKYYFRIESTDEAGNTAILGDTSNNFITQKAPDTEKPIISNLTVVIVTDTTATIEWTTNEQSTSWLDLGQGNPGTLPSVGNDDYVLYHNLTASDLKPSTKYYFQVRSSDKSGNEETSQKGTFVTLDLVDREPPQILSGPAIWARGESSATIVWTTDEESDSEISFGTTVDYGDTKSDIALVKSHQIILTGLVPSTTYHFRVSSRDEARNEVTSDDLTFTTLAITSPIDIEFFNIKNGDRVNGVITINGRVAGGVGEIQSVRYRIDDGDWIDYEPKSAFNIELDTTQFIKGQHILVVEAKVGEITMQEDVTFIVTDQTATEGESFPFVLLLGLFIFILLVVVLVLYKIGARRRVPMASVAPYSESDSPSYGFIPDYEPQAQSPMEDLSFIPEDISFEEPQPVFIPETDGAADASFEKPAYSRMDYVNCPRCKGMFYSDISSVIVCPHCGFSASLRN